MSKCMDLRDQASSSGCPFVWSARIDIQPAG